MIFHAKFTVRKMKTVLPSPKSDLEKALRTRVVYQITCHSVISPQNFGEKSGFSKGFYLEGSHFSKCMARNGFGKEFEFSDFCLGGSLIFDNLQRV